QPLLVYQARDDAEQWPFRRAEAQVGADRVAVVLLAVEVVGVEMMWQMRVTARIPTLIDAVHDARQLTPRCSALHQTVQSGALRLGGDLLGIGRTDGRDMAGIESARLEKRDVAVEFDSVDVES